ncbi:MAG: hypothetical protein ACRENB_13655 [Gemmatimonadales bacterium]
MEVIGERRTDIRIVAKVAANARTEGRAEEIARAVRLQLTGGRITAPGSPAASGGR